MSEIIGVKARQIYDSRGNPTVQCDITTKNGMFRAAVPSGASTGKYQAHQLRDNDPHTNLGKGVSKAVDNINKIIAQQIIGQDCTQQKLIDQKMVEKLDGSKGDYGWNKSKLGANAILAVSMAVCKAAASANNLPLYQYIHELFTQKNKQKKQFMLPCPSFNVINGGKHGGNLLPMQQFMILPTGATSFRQAMQYGSEVYHHLIKILKNKYGLSSTNVGDQGGFAPNISDHFQALQLIMAAIKAAGHDGKISIAMDCAASQFYDQQKKLYNLKFKSTQQSQLICSKDLLNIYEQLVHKYPIISIQDAFDQDDFQGWQLLTQKLGNRIQIVGDDLLVTNISRINQAVQSKLCNALLLKINQIGSITEALQAAQVSLNNRWGVMVSHRSGQTQDTFIADLVVGLNTGQIKTGAPCRSQRLAKYNQLLRIQQQLQGRCTYAGKTVFISSTNKNKQTMSK